MKPYLQKYKGPSTKHICPNCGAKKCFTLYVDGNTHQPIHSTVGICDRVNKCGYHYPPRMYFADNPDKRNQDFTLYRSYNPPDIETPVNYIPASYLIKSKSTESNFIDFLKTKFENSAIQKVANEYQLGATKNREIIYWQIDISDKIRTGKIMQYNPTTGKRIHNQSGAINWVHNKLKKQGAVSQNFNLAQCFFGEHLLRQYRDKTVGIVEGEKTAIIASIALPDYIWLATGALNGLSLDKSFVLNNRNVILFPDLGKAHEVWTQKANEISKFIKWNVQVSDLLIKVASEYAFSEGFDIADFIIS